jgi:hypothetical protein
MANCKTSTKYTKLATNIQNTLTSTGPVLEVVQNIQN